MRTPRAPSVRRSIGQIVDDPSHDGLKVSDIIDTLEKHHREIITVDLEEIVYIGLVKIAGEVCSLRSRAVPAGQGELFDGYKIAPLLATRIRVENGSSVVHKHVTNMSIAEARRYLEAHLKARSVPKRIEALAQLLDELGNIKGKPNATIGELWETRKAEAAVG